MKWQLVVLISDFVEALQSSAPKPKVELCTCDLIGKIFIYLMTCVFGYAFLAHSLTGFSGFRQNEYIMVLFVNHWLDSFWVSVIL